MTPPASMILMEGDAKPDPRNAAYHRFLNYILDHAEVDEISGQFVCLACRVTLDIDWFEQHYDCNCEDA